MHGAYMCYYNKQNKLHEEKYVGVGTARKIWDENVDVCRFVPPDRASYFYVQAVAGGGAGGSSGYNGKANRKVIKSAVEVISPFGITEDLLELKGFDADELDMYGGDLYAYARGDGEYGDAGNGGDLYYIKQETGNCFAYRKWSSQGSTPKTKVCKPHDYKTVYYGRYDESYTYLQSRTYWGPNDTDCKNWYKKSANYLKNNLNVENFTCDGWWYTTETETGCYGSGTASNPCATGSAGGNYWYCSSWSWSPTFCGWARYYNNGSWTTVCGPTSTYANRCDSYLGDMTINEGTDNEKTVTVQCRSGWSSEQQRYCTSAWYNYNVYDDGVCGSCSFQRRTTGSCNFTYNEPVFATCGELSETIKVYTEDTFAANNSANSIKPQLYVKKTDGKLDYGSGARHDNTCSGNRCDTDVRTLKINTKKTYSVCNYGNSGRFNTNNGIFGSCFYGGDYPHNDCSFTCNSSGVLEAFGDGVLVMGGSNTSISGAEDKKADDKLYENLFTTVNGKSHEGIYYARTEDLGMDEAFGTVCKNDYANGKICDGTTKTYSSDYTSPSPINGKNPATEYLPTDCNITEYKLTKVNNDTCDDKWRYGGCASHHSKDGYKLVSKSCRDSYYSKSGYSSYTCDDKDYTGQRCMYGTADLANKGGTYAGNVYGYIIDVVEGEEGGKGRKCSVHADPGVGLTYEAWSSIVPGINGSDKTTNTVNEYKALWCESCAGNWATWLNQTSVYADTGTDSIGAAYVNLNGALCDVHIAQPPEGGYGACLLPSESKYTLTTATGTTVSSKIPEAHAGVEHEACKYEAKGSCTHDDDVPSWCKPGDSRYPGCKNKNKDGTCNAAGCDKDSPAGCENGSFVGYCLKPFRGDIRQFGKYTYQYTWATNNLAYGNPGKPGEYKSMIIRSFKDRDMIIIPGKGGTLTGCAGGNGEDTLIYSVPRDAEVENSDFVTDVVGVELILQVAGGKGGSGCIPTDTEQLPYHFTEPFPSRSVKGDTGKAPTFNNRSNVMGMVLPLDDSILGKWLQYSGAAGDGGGSTNNFWASSWERWFEGQDVYGEIGEWSEEYLATHGEPIRYLDRWEEIPATPGIAGAVLIKW